jgi:hypothetical protein
VATRPHLSYAVYDEVAIGLWRWFGLPFEASLLGQQMVYRALQTLGIYLLALSFPLSPVMALGVAAIASLGAAIAGPAVLLVEFEPVPRAFAIGFVFLAIGSAARNRPVLASAVGAVGFLYHAPTTLPFWLLWLPYIIWKHWWKALIPLSVAVAIILVMAHFQPGIVEPQHFFFRIDPVLERLQRMRAPYNWVSIWAGSLMPRYLLLWAAALVAYWRIRPKSAQIFLLGLPLLGILSVLFSFVTLEELKWGLIPQLQPARTLLFVTGFALILGAAAGFRALVSQRWVEAVLWFVLALTIPFEGQFAKPKMESPTLDQLEVYAREHTPATAIFAFPDAGHGLYPGVFRVRAGRSVYVDWKSGGQVNYYRSLAEEWWTRWNQLQALHEPSPDLARLSALGIDYVVLPANERISGSAPVYQNSEFVVYHVGK